MSRRWWKGISILALFLVTIGFHQTSLGYEAEAARRIRASADSNSARWCGSEMVVWRSEVAGIFVGNTRTGKFSQVTRSFHHQEPRCFGDGRYILFRDVGSRRYLAVDRMKLTISAIPCLEYSAAVSEDLSRVVELRDVQTDSESCGQVVFPWGQTVQIEKVQVSPFEARFVRVAAWMPEGILLHVGKRFRHGDIPGGSILVAYSTRTRQLGSLGLPVTIRDLYRSRDGVLFYLEKEAHLGPGQRSQSLMRVPLSDPKATRIASDVIGYDITGPAEVVFIDKAGRLLKGDLRVTGNQVLLHAGPWSGHLRVSADGQRVLLTKLNPVKGVEGPVEPPITHSIHILNLNSQHERR